MAKLKEKNAELEELVEKNLLLYEHETKKSETLQKEWMQEKASAA